MVRHGRTAWNAEGRFQGHTDVALDETGRRQAEAAARGLATVPVVSVTSSDLSRALDTAQVIAAVHGIDVSVDAGLREVALGGWEGLTQAEAEARFGGEWRRWSAGEDIARGGGETRAEAGRRALPVLARIVAALPHGVPVAGPDREGMAAPAAVVVAHGYVLQAAVEALAALGAVAPLAGGAPHLDNGAWLDLRVERGFDLGVAAG